MTRTPHGDKYVQALGAYSGSCLILVSISHDRLWMQGREVRCETRTRDVETRDELSSATRQRGKTRRETDVSTMIHYTVSNSRLLHVATTKYQLMSMPDHSLAPVALIITL
eukprot:9477458-Pyramimonas_sp.AAC.1